MKARWCVLRGPPGRAGTDAVAPELRRRAASFLDAGGAAGEAAQVVQARAAHAAAAGDLDAFDARAVEGEGALDADAGRDASHGEVAGDTGLHADHDAFERLQALA